jgi:GNAT superfamily N-acetyltransferase
MEYDSGYPGLHRKAQEMILSGKHVSDEYAIVRYQPAHRDDVLELQKHLWSSCPDLNRSYLEWKYERNPYLNGLLIYLALCGGRVVGMRGMFGAMWEAGVPVKRFPGICTEDSVIHPDHRNRNISTKIMKTVFADMAAQGHRYLYSLSAVRVTLVSSLAMGWKSVGSFEIQDLRSRRAERLRILRERIGKTKVLWRWEKWLPGYRWGTGRRPLHKLQNCPSICRQTERYRIVLDKSPRAGEMADLVARIEYDGRIRHVRDQEYLSWRFRNPLHRYLFLYWEEKRLEGYLVLQEYLSDFRSRAKVNIVDWEGTSREVQSGLLQAALSLCTFPDLNIWTSTLSDESKELLRGAGFRPVHAGSKGIMEIPSSLLVKSLQAGVPPAEWSLESRRLLDMSNWDLRMIYSMNG